MLCSEYHWIDLERTRTRDTCAIGQVLNSELCYPLEYIKKMIAKAIKFNVL